MLSLAALAIAKRRGTSRASIDEALGTVRGGERACFFRMPRVAFSSTMVRDRVRNGQSIRYIVPDGVANYINEHGLYGGSTRT